MGYGEKPVVTVSIQIGDHVALWSEGVLIPIKSIYSVPKMWYLTF